MQTDIALRQTQKHRQPLDQGLAALGGHVQQNPFGLAQDEQVEQQPAGRGQQGAEPQLAVAQPTPQLALALLELLDDFQLRVQHLRQRGGLSCQRAVQDRPR